jgi:histidine triad (HIT) family protein
VSNDCLFCRIAARELDTDLVYEDEQAVAFNDINPQAPTHVLVVPRRHIERLSDLTADDKDLMGHLANVAANVARKRGLNDYRVVINCGEGAGQSIWHIHLHLLGGRPLRWPPG